MIRASIEEAKAKLEELIEKAAMGETVVIATDQHKATLTAEPLYSERGQLLASQKGILIYMAENFNEPLEDFKDYMP